MIRCNHLRYKKNKKFIGVNNSTKERNNKTMEKQRKYLRELLRKQGGITLIALVITIIVLLILAGVTIATLTGDEGILSRANKAAEETIASSELEKINIAVTAAYIERKGTLNEDNLKKSLNESEFVVENNLKNKDNGWIFNVNGNLYKIGLDSSVKLIFSEKTFKIGEAKNIENYGRLVDFKSENGSSQWKLFYQDEKYAYLIYDGMITEYDYRNYLAYNDGSYVSKIGQKLSPKINNLFTTENTNYNIRYTAWLLDTKHWGETNKYEDTEGIAIFVIGSPTIELFAASYNVASEVAKTHGYNLNIEMEGEGYKSIETSSGYFFSSDKNGIYNCEDGFWWLASPWNGQYYNFRIIAAGYWTLGDVTGSIHPGIRPIVCISASDLILK